MTPDTDENERPDLDRIELEIRERREMERIEIEETRRRLRQRRGPIRPVA